MVQYLKEMTNANDIKSVLTLTQVAELYQIPLTKADGRQPCPFCSSSSAFKVTRNEYYRCFKCAASGDIFKLLQDARKAKDFKEAFHLLRNHCGGLVRQQELTYSYLDLVWQQLTYHAYCFPEVINEFLAKRGYSESLKPQVGYYPTKEEEPDFYNELISKSKIPDVWLEEHIPWGYEGRIVFAVRTGTGNIIHFTGRATDPAIEPRWLHTKGSPGINNYLYGLSNLRKSDADYAILCEGVTDCHSLLELGEPAIACFGVNVSLVQHAWALKDLTHLVAFLDRDKYPLGHKRAGEYKSWSGMVPALIELAIELKIAIYCCMVPNSSGVKDINDFVLKLEYDSDEFRRYMANEHVSLHDFAFEMYHRDPKKHDLLWRLYIAVPNAAATNKLKALVESQYKDWTEYLMEII